MIPVNIFDQSVNYEASFGPSTVPERLGMYAGEFIGDITKGDRITTEGQFIYQADNDFNVLKLESISVLAKRLTEGRVLKSVQDAINKTLDPLEPGVLKFDVKTLSALKALRKSFAGGYQLLSERLPELDGDATQFNNAQIFNARQDSKALRQIIAEYTQFIDQLEYTLGGKQKNIDKKAAQAIIYQNAQKAAQGPFTFTQ